MRDNFFYHNGRFVKTGTAIVSPEERGLRYGDGLFETMKWRDGQLLHADEHFARLWKGLEVLQFEVPRQFTPAVLEEKIATLCSKNGHTNLARIRLMVYRGIGGLYDARNHVPNCVIEATVLPEGNGTWNSNGLVIGMYKDAVKPCDILANCKHNNFLPYVLAALEAKKQKWNDAVLLNMHGRICDTTIANIFIIKNEAVFTPSLTEGCVAGVQRRHLLALLRSNGWQVTETAITPEALLAAEEVFVTNAIYNLRWVQRIDDAEYGNALTQRIYTLLQSTI